MYIYDRLKFHFEEGVKFALTQRVKFVLKSAIEICIVLLSSQFRSEKLTSAQRNYLTKII